MAAESKIYNPTERREEWVEVVKNNNHLWDCEHMQAAAAWRVGCGIPPPPQEQQPEPKQSTDPTPFGGARRW
jgi:hypothetical protein